MKPENCTENRRRINCMMPLANVTEALIMITKKTLRFSALEYQAVCFTI